MELKNIIDQLNYEIFEGRDDICLHYTDTTYVQYIGLQSWGTTIPLWDSESDGGLNDYELIEHLKNEVSETIAKLMEISMALSKVEIGR